jgi:purine catabolism regulatory family protein/PucR-like helix-turn-helix protein
VPNPAAALRVEDLARSPALQLKLVAGAGGLPRRVSWAHVSELEDPTPWLLGAEAIMTTGIAVPRAPRRQQAYLERLDDAGVAALLLSEKLHVPPLHPGFLRAAEERDLPVLEVPLTVPFIAVAQEVAAAVQADMRQGVSAQLQVFGALRWLTAEDLDRTEVFRRLEKLSGYSLFACTRQGRPLVQGLEVPPVAALHLLPASPAAPPAVPGGLVLPVPEPGGAAGWLLALERAGTRPAGLAVVQHMATVVALLVTMSRHERETLRREGAETFSELLRGAVGRQTARHRLDRAGFPAEASLLLAAARRDDPAEDAALVRALEEAEEPHLLLSQQQVLYVLVPDSGPVRAALAGLAGLPTGISRPFRAGDPLDVPRREALWAASRAAESGRSVVEYGAADGAERWLPDDPSALRGLVAHVLGPALDHDAQHGGQLVASLRTWLERDRRTASAARALRIHPNTLLYRLRRFSELTGRDLSSSADLAEIWLALAATRHTPP